MNEHTHPQRVPMNEMLGRSLTVEDLRRAWVEHIGAHLPQPAKRVLWHRCGPDCAGDILARASGSEAAA